MKWSDKDIDKLYSDSSERLSFDYKESYWDAFEKSLPQSDNVDTPNDSSFTDAKIDSMYASSAAGLSFDYKQDFWDEFQSSLPDAAPKPALTDAEIDAMYATSAAGLSFAYNKSYWNEFEAVLPNATPNAALTDAEIDAMYATSAAGLSFAYNKSYWNEFEASLPNATPKAALTDAEIDAMYATSAAGLSFAYSRQYWNDFNQSFASAGGFQAADDAVLADNAIDELYQESANDLSFEYQNSYWEEFTALLRRKRRPDFLWFATAYTFVGVIGLMLFVNNGMVGDFDEIEFAENVGSRAEQLKASATNGTSESAFVGSGINLTEDQEKELKELMASYESNQGSAPNSSTPTLSEPVDPSRNIARGPITAPSSPVTPAGSGIDPVAPIVPVITPRVIDIVTGGATTPIDTKPTDPRDTKEITKPRNKVLEPAIETDLASTQRETMKLLPYRGLEFGINSSMPALNGPFSGPKASYARWYAQGIGGLSQSLVVPSNEISNSIGFGLGLELNKRNFTFTFGLNALAENHNDLILTRSAKIYINFDSELHKYQQNYQQLYTVEAMIGAGYNLRRHRFELGIRPSFVVNSRVHIQDYTIERGGKEPGIEEVAPSRNVFGVMDGINRFGLKPTIGYSFKLSPIWSIGGTFGVELMPSFNEEFINGVNNSLPLDGQVYLRRTFSFTR